MLGSMAETGDTLGSLKGTGRALSESEGAGTRSGIGKQGLE